MSEKSFFTLPSFLPFYFFTFLPFTLPFCQRLRQFGHCTFLCADESTNLDSEVVCLLDALAREDRSREGACERVAGTHCVSNLHLWCLLIALYTVWSKDIASVGATCQHNHLQVVALHDEAAFLFNVQARIAKEAADDDQLLIVNLQDVAVTEPVLNGVLVVEGAAQVDVGDLQSVLWCSLKEPHDGLARLLAALCQ